MFDIEPFLHRHFDVVMPYGNPVTDLRVDCRQCGDNKQHLHVSLHKQVTHCFRCGYSKDWIGLVMDIMGVPYHIALGELYRRARVSDFNTAFEDTPVKHQPSYQVTLPNDYTNILESDDIQARMARKYMKKRGFGPLLWKKYNIGVSPELWGRVVIPIEYEYWQARAISDSIQPKYINPRSPSGEAIFNSGAMDIYDEVVVCEGAFSAMAVADNAIALIGKEGTTAKTDRLIQSDVSHFILTVEPGAIKNMLELADKLNRNGKRITLWVYKDGDPADSSVFAEIEYSFKNKLEALLK